MSLWRWRRRKKEEEEELCRAMDWYRFISESLVEIRLFQPHQLTINPSQCSLLASVTSSKLSKFWPHPPLPPDPHDASTSDPDSSSSHSSSRRRSFSPLVAPDDDRGDSSAVFDHCKHALKEVYRVIKEVEAFVHVCSGRDWWKTALIRGDTGEALAVHIHDLVWAVAALDSAIHHAGGATLERCDVVCSRRVVECYSELSSPYHRQNESIDRKRLVSMLTRMKAEFDSMTSRRRRTLRIEQENKYRIAAFLLRKLEGSMATSAAPTQELPESLSINPKDLNFAKRRLLGRGSYGAVYEASWLGLRLAVKELPCADSESFKEEASILAKLRSPFIVQLIGWSVHLEANVCYLVMELANNNLKSHIEERCQKQSDRPPFSLRVAVDIMLQISRGMEYLHSQHVVHRDLRASNVLVDDSTVREFLDEGYVRVKLCDFGMAKAKLNSSRFVSSMKGASYWRAPEVFSHPVAQENGEARHTHYTNKADVYSFAMTCYEILTGQQPFAGVLHKDMYRVIMEGGRPQLPDSCPSFLADYIKQCWHGDDRCRPSFHEICKMLRHVKLILMRIDDPEDVSFLSVTSEYDYGELSSHLSRTTIQSCGRGSKEEQNHLANNSDRDSPAKTLEVFESSGSSMRVRGTSTFQRIRSMLSFVSKPMEMEAKEEEFLSFLPGFITRFSIQELRTATANFSVRIGKGESGCVFRGVLSDEIVVAVRVVEPHLAADVRLFCLMVSALSNAYHSNLIHFRGFCIESSCRILVYDYMENLSLDRWLLSPTGGSRWSHLYDHDSVQDDVLLDWGTRRKIALGASRGLAYLHEDCGCSILPIGVKSSKILLDEPFEAKINSLNLLEPETKAQIFTNVISLRRSSSSALVTSPEVQAAQRSDVYSFGIILFEMAVGHAVDLPKTAPDEGLGSLLAEPRHFFELLDGQPELYDPSTDPDGRDISGLLDLIDVRLKEKVHQEVDVSVFFQIALWCIQDAENRPTMSQVVQVLEGGLQIPAQLMVSFNSLM